MTKDIGARIRSAREAAKLSRTQLADLLEIDASVLGRIEAGKVGVSATRLVVIASLLKTRAAVLLGEETGTAAD